MAKEPKKTRPVLEVLTDSIKDRAGGYVAALVKGESEIDKKGGSAELYAQILRDDQVKSALQQRRTGMTSCAWEINPGGDTPLDEAAAEEMQRQLDAIDFAATIEHMHYGFFYGYSVAEMLWSLENEKVAIAAIKVRNRHRFRFDGAGQLRLLSKTNPDGILMPDNKFWVFATGADNDDSPYGLGLAHWLYWPCFFKRNGLRLWLLFLDKFASPSAKGKYAPNATDDEKKRLLEAVQALRQDGAVVIPEGMEIELIEAVRSATVDYDTLYSRMDAAISKVILSQTMTTDNGSSLSQAEVHEEVGWAVVEADARALASSWNNGPGKWWTEWNFPGAAAPVLRFITEPPENLAAAVERDEKLSNMGWRPTEERVREVYGEGYERYERPEPSFPGVANFAAPPASARPQDAIDQFIARDLDGDWEELVDPVLGPLHELMARATSYDDLIAKLPSVLPEMDAAALAEHLARAAFAARLAALTGADDDAL